MSNYLKYKGFSGTVEYSAEDDILYGKIIGISGLAMYFGNSLDSLKKDFYESVDFHLSHCAEANIESQDNNVVNVTDVAI